MGLADVELYRDERKGYFECAPYLAIAKDVPESSR